MYSFSLSQFAQGDSFVHNWCCVSHCLYNPHRLTSCGLVLSDDEWLSWDESFNVSWVLSFLAKGGHSSLLLAELSVCSTSSLAFLDFRVWKTFTSIYNCWFLFILGNLLSDYHWFPSGHSWELEEDKEETSVWEVAGKTQVIIIWEKPT